MVKKPNICLISKELQALTYYLEQMKITVMLYIVALMFSS